ncbi:penicillin-binding protein activator [Sphingomonas sp. HT-1]|uniref:penicillin-binding protein activator n=1 Tax=unclassified Sphingomonas TaxID=196159 RepID=UPI0003091F85|nr:MULTISPECIES: penicillin-binding protein activator [unclassified Sphingomonas]KTF68147.1 ABC transporter substrate-binding protein [Sphingomonas sp. WG]
MAEGSGRSQPGRFAPFRWAVAGLALLASACVAPRGGPPPVTTAPAERPAERPTPIAPGLPQDVARHRVALLVPLSGNNAGLGRSLQNATQLAILDTNTDAIRITSYDTAGPGGAQAAAERAIAEGNKLILGPLLAEDARAVAPAARRARVPVLSFSNDSSAAGGGVYLLGYSPTQSIERVVDYAKGNGITNFAGLIPSGVYGQRASTAFLRAVESAGGKVLAMQNYDARPGSMNQAIAKLAGVPYQAILIAGSAGTATVAVPVLRRSANGKAARVLGTELWNTDSAIASRPVLNGSWFASVPDGVYRQYATKYRSRFGAAPYRLSALGYDAVLLTVRIARDWKNGTDFPAAQLSDRDFGGVDGAFRFGRDGIAARALEVQEVRDGTIVTVSAAPASAQ